jgi:hypothetical protein
VSNYLEILTGQLSERAVEKKSIRSSGALLALIDWPNLTKYSGTEGAAIFVMTLLEYKIVHVS